ncbi:glycosyltransferase [Paenibacillus sp. J2TS4]|uniref:glycosyltransferase family 2 protein n=1 Tax=Paenibacillus sp. J2TS4 TaxID=2807194 RepID=UPI001B0F7AF9|nr:glycosyltransferase [Paenibacillus sp. J2TS4]GIP31298.1 hypothetical protein J2TS4_05080 [Paenibacillus sp. J2TS4]
MAVDESCRHTVVERLCLDSGKPKVSVIIPVMNERRTLASVIRQARKVHPQTEVIVVANGCKDGSDRIASRMGTRVIRFPRPLGHDVGRSIGARAAEGDILLFMDGDIIIPVGQLRTFISAIEQGTDIALNSYIGPVNHRRIHPVVLSKHALNIILGKPELSGASLTTTPHAMSRKALEWIGAENLCVPPLAQAIAVHKGLQLQTVRYVRVGKNNPNKQRKHSVKSLIVGDHLEAISWYLWNGFSPGKSDVYDSGLSEGLR